jgi:hypothetical protein
MTVLHSIDDMSRSEHMKIFTEQRLRNAGKK